MIKFYESFHAPPRHPLARNPYWKYGFLAVVGALLVFSACLFVYSRAQGQTRENLIVSYDTLIVPLILIFNHLSSYFYFGPRFTFPFRIFSALFLLSGGAWVLGSLFWMIHK